ncbi:MAG: ribosome assembly cofactor RimP [Flavobacteriales bacterium]
MITKEQIIQLIEEKITGTDIFIVEVNVRPGNHIDVTLDADTAVSIEHCTEVHRHILKNIDRELEDYALEISSPDLGKPLRHYRQYMKNIGRGISVKKQDNTRIEGTLMNAGDNGIVIHQRSRQPIPGRKAKQWVDENTELSYADIKETKIVISFK